jgi:predicted nucleic acid-binding protein
VNDIRVLLDTNIFIYREDNRVIPEHLQELLRLMSALNIRVLVHPMLVDDIERDPNSDRMKISLSKLGAYTRLASPPRSDGDTMFVSKFGSFFKPNDKVDSELLYAVYKNAVHLLITEDAGIKKKASKLGLSERVLGILDAQALFSGMMPNESLDAPPLIEHCPVHNLDINDPFFGDIKQDYSDFTSWFINISREGRYCYVYFKSKNRIGALLIYKDETESFQSSPSLPLAHRLKLCTFKVEKTGYTGV